MLGTSEGVIVLDGKKNVLMLSPQARVYLGLKPGDRVRPEELFSKFEGIYIAGAVEEARRKGTIVFGHARAVGDENDLHFGVYPLRLGREKIAGMVIVLRDITGESELERAKSEFVSTVSHELRTPLTIAREGVSQVLDGLLGNISHEQKEFLGVSLGAVDRLGGLINDLLDVSRLETGRLELERNLMDMVEVVRGVEKGFRPSAREKGLEIRTRFSGENIYLYADRERVIQLFTNLIENALKFTEKGRIELDVRTRDGFVECGVKDTGKGIAKADLSQVFARFQQFGRQEGPGERGTGLGLAISKALVELHGGKIEAHSKLYRGSRFTFSLPYGSAEEVFQDYSARATKKAIQEGKPLSVIHIETPGTGDAAKGVAVKTDLSQMIKWGALVRLCLRHEEDVEVTGFGNIYVLLPGAKPEGADHVARRIRQKWDDQFSNEVRTRGLELGFRILSLPNDFLGEDELMAELSRATPQAREVLATRMINEEIRSARLRGDPRGFSIIVVHIVDLFQMRMLMGHEVYERVVGHVRHTVGEHVRGSRDRVTRTKLGQVLVLLPDTDEKAAFMVSAKLSELLHARDLEIDGRKIPLKLKFGIAHYPKDGSDAESLVRTADQRIIHGKKILIVDDHPQVVKLLCHRIRARNGFRCLEAYGGREALEKARQEVPDLIVLDLMMPDMNGYEVIGRLKEDEKTRDIPIIVLTAFKVDSEKIPTLSPGSLPVVTKSGGFRHLMELVEKLI